MDIIYHLLIRELKIKRESIRAKYKNSSVPPHQMIVEEKNELVDAFSDIIDFAIMPIDIHLMSLTQKSNYAVQVVLLFLKNQYLSYSEQESDIHQDSYPSIRGRIADLKESYRFLHNSLLEVYKKESDDQSSAGG